MRIGFVCCEYPPGPHGGGGTFTQVLARALVAAGHEVRVVGIYKHTYPAPDYELDRGVEVWRIRQPQHRFGWISGRLKLFQRVSRWARQGLIDLVEVPDWQGWAAGWPRLPVPVVTRSNGSASYFAHELGSKIRSTTYWLERAGMRRSDYWCSVSRYTAEQTRKVFSLPFDPNAILYNPVEASIEVPPASRSRHDVVFSGTLTVKKGVVSLIKAWPQVLDATNGNARLHLYGKDGRTDSGDSMARVLLSMLDPAQRATVRFHGHTLRSELFNAFNQAGLAIFPSYAEAFAIAPLEAMSTACPTIYSNRGSGGELICHGENGLLVDPDDTDGMAAAMVRLIEDEELAGRLGKAGQALVANRFTDVVLLNKNISFYQSCLGVDPPISDTAIDIAAFPRMCDVASSVAAVET